MQLVSTFDCEKLLVGTCTTGTTDLGFYWDGLFKLKQYVEFLYFNPTYPIDGRDYEYSTGTRSVTSGRKEKYYDAETGYVDETTHDSVSTMIMCDSFTVDGVEHFVKQDDYKPDWQTKNGELLLSKGKMLMRKKQSTIFKTNQ